jgi:anti-sigma-K factor RskA
MSSDHFEDIGAYLLGALEPDEHEAFESALETDARLRHEVDQLRFAAAALPASAEQLAPPPDLKRRVMAIVEAEAALIHPDRQAQTAPRRRWWQLSPQPRLAFAAVAVVLVLGAGALICQTVAGDDRTVIAAEVGDARLIERGDDDHATLVVEQLPPPGADHTYQVWIQRDGEQSPTPTNALFSTRNDGTASVDVPGSLDDVEAVLVTQEPKGGSQTPTTDPVIIARPA